MAVSASLLIGLKGGSNKVRGNRIQTCRSESDSDHAGDKVRGQNGDGVCMWVSEECSGMG